MSRDPGKAPAPEPKTVPVVTGGSWKITERAASLIEKTFAVFALLLILVMISSAMVGVMLLALYLVDAPFYQAFREWAPWAIALWCLIIAGEATHNLK